MSNDVLLVSLSETTFMTAILLNPLIERGTMQWSIKPRVTCEKIISC